MCLCVCVSVSLLELVVPLVEVDVENNHRASRQASHQEFLVVRESETSDARVTGWESVEQGEVESPPYLNYSLVPTGHHIFSVS